MHGDLKSELLRLSAVTIATLNVAWSQGFIVVVVLTAVCGGGVVVVVG
jgi:hypothetical protein